MASQYWIKLYVEIIDDPKMGRLSRSLRYRVIEMLVLAGECNQHGYLPPLEDMAWKLRENVETLESDLIELAKSRILDQRNGNWYVVNFEKRQAPSSNAKRVQEFRKRQRNADVTKSYTSNAPESVSETETESEAKIEEEVLLLPLTPLEASKHPDIQLFQRVSRTFPGVNDYRIVIDAVRFLRQNHPHETELESYLTPFWLAWDNLKRTDGKPANKTNPTWLTEWAVQNRIPDPRTATAQAQVPASVDYAVHQITEAEFTPEVLARMRK